MDIPAGGRNIDLNAPPSVLYAGRQSLVSVSWI
jgi:hypothetical protein